MLRLCLRFIFIVIINGCGQNNSAVKSVEDYKAAAHSVVKSIRVEDAIALKGDVIMVDVREEEELDRSGVIPGAVHVPRGVLEFYIDPASAMHLEIFTSDRRMVFLCETGGRSLLATKVAIDMGVKNPLLLAGGFKAWAEAGGPVEQTAAAAKQ